MEHFPTFEQYSETQRSEQLRNANHASQQHGFIVRVELHQVENSQDYKALRKYMLAEGFQGIVANKNMVWFKLPTATYYYPYPTPAYLLSSSAVHEKALHAVQTALDDAYAYVKAANRVPTILVTETEDQYWTGLELAEIDDE